MQNILLANSLLTTSLNLIPYFIWHGNLDSFFCETTCYPPDEPQRYRAKIRNVLNKDLIGDKKHRKSFDFCCRSGNNAH
jgi:hypothetical protein